MDFHRLCQGLLLSWSDQKGKTNSTDDLLGWIQSENARTRAILRRCPLSESSYWFYDTIESEITNKNQSFFSIKGIKGILSDGRVFEQPIILQNEVGYLGFIIKEIDGEIQLLMQAKIEPGNINNVQISPTIQATESNFTQKHGGRKPCYLEFFANSSHYLEVYDGEEPEQCSRFLGKKNRNVAIFVDEDIEVYPHFRWMSVGQIKFLATHFPNLVNMDTRTVLSCLPFDMGLDEKDNTSLSWFLRGEDETEYVFSELARYRSFANNQTKLVRLDLLHDWILDDNGIRCRLDYPFEIQYYDIEIQGREVTHWSQPLAVARGQAVFGMFVVDCCGKSFFLIRIKEEIGCSEVAFFGPTVQMEPTELASKKLDSIESLFFDNLYNKKGVLVDTVLSEEGGRFYHEENRNVLLFTSKQDLPNQLPDGYFLANYRTLRQLIAKYHCLNIQLRDLISLCGNKL